MPDLGMMLKILGHKPADQVQAQDLPPITGGTIPAPMPQIVTLGGDYGAAPAAAPAVAPPSYDPANYQINAPMITGEGAPGTAPVMPPPPVVAPPADMQPVPETAAAPQPAAAPEALAGTPGTTPEERYKAITQKDYSITKNPDGTETRGKDRKAKGKWSIWDKVSNALIGWATGGLAGGIAGATDRNYRSKLHDRMQSAILLPQIQAKQQIEAKEASTEYQKARPTIEANKIKAKVQSDRERYRVQLQVAADRAKTEGDKWVPYTDPETGLVYKQYRNKADGGNVPLTDPTTGEQLQDPTKKLYDWVDPTSGQTVKINGGQLASAGAQIATGNAQRTQAAATTNASQDLEAQKANQRAILDYQKNVVGVTMQMVTQAAGALSVSAESQAAAGRMQAAAQRMNDADAAMASAPEGKELTAAQTAYNSALKEFTDAESDFTKSTGKFQQGQQLLQALQQARGQIARPQMVTAPKIAPSIVGGAPQTGRNGNVDTSKYEDTLRRLKALK